MKKFTHLSLKFLLVICLFWNVSAQARDTPEEKAHFEEEIVDMVNLIGLYDGVYFEAMKHPSDNLTHEVSKSALNTIMMLWFADNRSRNEDNHIEPMLASRGVNGLCLASKVVTRNILPNPKYLKMDKIQKDFLFDKEFVTWLNQKQVLWQDILKKSKAPKLKHSCLDIA